MRTAAAMVSTGALAVLVAVAGAEEKKAPVPAGKAPRKAVAVLHPTRDSKVEGTATFVEAEHGVKVSVRMAGLTAGAHGFHVHEFGDCSAPDGASAGGHFNPMGSEHGGPKADKRHVGDLGNIEAGADGTATLEYQDHVLSFDGAGNIVGRGVIVHAKADDLKTQPTGDAGGRQACGVIGVAKAE